MRFLRTHVEDCVQHPNVPKVGNPGGGIQCGACGIELGQWNLPWQPQWAISTENVMARAVAWALPHSVVRCALARAIAHATQPCWGDAHPPTAVTITAHDVALRWELRTPAPRLPHLPEWLRDG